MFPKDLVEFAGTEEYVIKGGRDKYALLPKAFDGVKQVGVIGWGSQAPAQAQNMRDSFAEAGMDVKVAIGLRPDSPSVAEAEACGFSKKDGTLGDVFDIISSSDLVVLLISDAAQVRGGARAGCRSARSARRPATRRRCAATAWLSTRADARRAAAKGWHCVAAAESSGGAPGASAAAGGGVSATAAHRPPDPRTAPQAKLYPRVLAAMKPGATLGLSHGFLLGVMQSDGVDFRKDINVVLVAPKVRPAVRIPPLRQLRGRGRGRMGQQARWARRAAARLMVQLQGSGSGAGERCSGRGSGGGGGRVGGRRTWRMQGRPGQRRSGGRKQQGQRPSPQLAVLASHRLAAGCDAAALDAGVHASCPPPMHLGPHRAWAPVCAACMSRARPSTAPASTALSLCTRCVGVCVLVCARRCLRWAAAAGAHGAAQT